MEVRDWLDSELGIDIWERKYRYNGESFDNWLDRVSNGNKELRQLIIEKKFLFGGRILSNRGLHKTGKKVTYSNCYVVAPPEDNIESIFECASKLARTFSYGGGVGIDISKLAPRGSRVNNTAKETSGAVSFMDLYSMVTGLIGQNGRRGALMISIDCNHPDLEEFIEIKSDLDKVTKANISIRVTSEFLEAVKNKQNYILEFIREETGEKITKVVDAHKLFNKFAEMNWDYAEPALLYWDRIENWCLLSNTEEFKFAGTNPCFSGGMQLLTVDGYKTFEELCGTEPYIYNVNGNIVKSKVWCSGEKDTVKVKIGKGEIICTPDHRFMTIDGDECMAKDLKGKYIMPCTTANTKFNERYVKLGFIQGDGQLSRLNSQYHDGLEVNIGKKDTDIFDLFSNESFTSKSERAIYLSGFNEELVSLGFSPTNLPERVFPTTYHQWTKNKKASFLHGCYSANGSVIKNGRIAYKTTCKKFAEQLSETLLNDFEIQGVYITTNKPQQVKFENGEYECRESYDVNIGKYKEITKFIAEINFYQQYKREQLAQMMKNRPTYVYNVEPYKTIKVYDFTEPERHWGIVEGYVVHNCAEEPLPSGGSCLLGSVNLSEFVDRTGTFNYDDFATTVRTSTRALNEILDEGLPLHPLQEQRDSVRDWRQIGLGIMGLADMLIKMGVEYGSSESIKLCDEIGRVMINETLRESAYLAQEHGVYPKFNYEDVSSTDFYKYNVDTYVDTLIKKYGLRNSQLLTIAPTGTLSTMLGISGGIEPVFANYYERKTESLHDKEVTYKVYTPIVEQYMKENGIVDDKDLPSYFITAQILNYKNRIDMQSVWQSHIDASISSTVNVPNEFTVEDVEGLYLYAYEKGLKGVTIFRDGCKRLGVLTVNNDSDEEIIEDDLELEQTLKRGDILCVSDDLLSCKRTVVNGCGKFYIHCDFDEYTGEPLETFIEVGSGGGCERNLQFISRLISLLLRAGVPVDEIVDQAMSIRPCKAYTDRTKSKGDTSKGTSCPSAIGYALKELQEKIHNRCFDDDMDKVTTQNEESDICSDSGCASCKTPCHVNEVIKSVVNPCPICGTELSFSGGCNFCAECGWSKCD